MEFEQKIFVTIQWSKKNSITQILAKIFDLKDLSEKKWRLAESIIKLFSNKTLIKQKFFDLEHNNMDSRIWAETIRLVDFQRNLIDRIVRKRLCSNKFERNHLIACIWATNIYIFKLWVRVFWLNENISILYLCEINWLAKILIGKNWAKIYFFMNLSES